MATKHFLYLSALLPAKACRSLSEETKGQVPISRSRFRRVEVGLYTVIPRGAFQAWCGSLRKLRGSALRVWSYRGAASSGG